MKQTLATAVMTSIEALLQVPGTQLQHIESTLRQLRTDLKEAGITPPAELDNLIEDAAIAHAEEMAILKDCIGPDEPDFTEEDEEEFYRMNYYEMYGCNPILPSDSFIHHITNEYGEWNAEKGCYELDRKTAFSLAIAELNDTDELPF